MTTFHRSLGLRRGAAAPAPTPAVFQDQVPYGLHRGLPRRRVIPVVDSPVIEETAPRPVEDHIQAPAEADSAIDGVETAAPVSQETPVSQHPGYWEWTDGELIPDVGPYTSKEGYRWMDGVPAFLFEDRPQSNIR